MLYFFTDCKSKEIKLINSILFGAQGSYKIGNITINYDPVDNGEINILGNNLFSKLGKALLTNKVMAIVSLGYLHITIHELGHAIAEQMLAKRTISSTITVFTKTCTGNCSVGSSNERWKEIAILIAGPLADVLFSIMQCMLGFMCISAGFFGSTCLGSILIASGVSWIAGELFYATRPYGDVGKIVHLVCG